MRWEYNEKLMLLSESVPSGESKKMYKNWNSTTQIFDDPLDSFISWAKIYISDSIGDASLIPKRYWYQNH